MTDWIGAPLEETEGTWPEPLTPFPGKEKRDASPRPQPQRGFTQTYRASEGRGLARTGTIHTPHGQIKTPAFIPVGTKADVKGLLPEMVLGLGAQAVLANAYHLYLQPGSDIVEQAGGFGRFMHWPGPTYTDSGGFQVLSMGAGFKKVLSEEFAASKAENEEAVKERARAIEKESRAVVDEGGVTFRSHIDGTSHRFTPETSIGIQHQLGADIMFAFDELTSLSHSRQYQEESLERTERWARQCLREHRRLTDLHPERPYQQLWGVVQGADYQDLRVKAARDLAQMDEDGQSFDGFGIGGALRKEDLGEIVSWVTPELPEDRGRHLLGISEPFDLFEAVNAGIDTFDCVNPTRVARNGGIYTPDGRYNITNARFTADFGPLAEGCGCYTCTNFSRAYVKHLFKAKEILASTLATIHNLWFTVRLVDAIGQAVTDGRFVEFRDDALQRFYGPNLPGR